MFTTVLILYIIVCIALILVILSQASKGGALEGMLGGTASSMLGAHEASSFLKKWTRYLGIAFFILSLGLAFIVQRQAGATEKTAVEKLQGGEIVPQEEEKTDKPGMPGQPMQLNPGGAQPIQINPQATPAQQAKPAAQPKVDVKPAAPKPAAPAPAPAPASKPATGN